MEIYGVQNNYDVFEKESNTCMESQAYSYDSAYLMRPYWPQALKNVQTHHGWARRSSWWAEALKPFLFGSQRPMPNKSLSWSKFTDDKPPQTWTVFQNPICFGWHCTAVSVAAFLPRSCKAAWGRSLAPVSGGFHNAKVLCLALLSPVWPVPDETPCQSEKHCPIEKTWPHAQSLTPRVFSWLNDLWYCRWHKVKATNVGFFLLVVCYQCSSMVHLPLAPSCLHIPLPHVRDDRETSAMPEAQGHIYTCAMGIHVLKSGKYSFGIPWFFWNMWLVVRQACLEMYI